MKKFLCYDTNDAASGKIGVNSNGVLKPNSTVPSTNGASYQQLVTDGSGNTKWEDRLAYEYTEWKDFTLSLGKETEITGFTMPPVGDTVTVKVNGVESVETVKSGEIEGGGPILILGQPIWRGCFLEPKVGLLLVLVLM